MRPCRAVIWLRTELCEVLPRGECVGGPGRPGEAPLLSIPGKDRASAEEKMNAFLAELAELCRKYEG